MAKANIKHANLTERIVSAFQPEGIESSLHDAKVPGLFLRARNGERGTSKTWFVTWGRNNKQAIGKWPGVTVDAAREQARVKLVEADTNGAPEKRSTDTVADACRGYAQWLRDTGRTGTAGDVEGRFERTIYSDAIGKIRLSNLSQDDMEAWRGRIERGDLAELPAKKGRPPVPKPMSKATVNRYRTTLVAALNRAVSRRRVRADRAIEWESVKPYESAGNRRNVYLEREQRRALFDAAAPDVRDLIECVALTGCRPGDPAEVKRSDYDPRHATARFITKNHPRIVPLSPAAKVLFDRLAKGKKSSDYLFTHGGKKWTSDEWSQHFREAARAAGLGDDVVLYTLRHCWITDAIIGGLDLLTVARLAGTSLAMIEKHYGHLVQSAARDKLAKVEFL